MKARLVWIAFPMLATACTEIAAGSGDDVASVAQAVETTGDVKHDVSPPLSSLAVLPQDGARERREKPLHLFSPPDGLARGEADPVAQTTAPAVSAATAILNFAGVGNGDYGFAPNAAPPDTNGAVGDTQFVQWVNESFAVFDKTTGALVFGPAGGNTLWQGFGGPCEANNDGDPIAQYDKVAQRWVLSQFSVSGTAGFFQCIAISTSSDATGSYFRYAFPQPNFNDYPKLGVWPDGYYVTFNIFGQTFQGARVCAFDRVRMLTGAAATQECVQLSTSFASLLPSDLDGRASPPPAGSPNFLLNFGSNSLRLWKFHADFANPANAALVGPTTIAVAAFSPACGGGACVPQSNTRQKLDSLGDRLMYRLAYRNRGGIETLVVSHAVKVSGTNKSEVDGVRWYELRNPNGTPAVFQQATFSPDSASRWMSSAAMDKVGDIAVGYSASSSTIHPGIRYAVRQPGDPSGTLQAETSIIEGGGSQLSNLNRWGDYSAMTVDPVDDCTFWYTSEYLKADGTFNWSTRIASFKLASCL
jgi:hypothetical protein